MPIQEFSGVEPKSRFGREVVEALKGPVRLAANWHSMMGFETWYGKVFEGDPTNLADQKRFKAELELRAADNPDLLSPFTIIGENWEPLKMSTEPRVKRVLDRISSGLLDAATLGSELARSEPEEELIDYLKNKANLLTLCDFKGIMALYLQLSTKQRIGVLISAVEYHDDPLGRWAAPQGLLYYNNSGESKKAYRDFQKLSLVGERLYGTKLMPTKVYVANQMAGSGFWGKFSRRPSACNLPNEPISVKNSSGVYVPLPNVMQFFPNGTKETNETRLKPALFYTCGVASKWLDAFDFVKAHETAHGYRYLGEKERLGSLNSAVQEAKANSRALVLTREAFDQERVEGVVRAYLAYASDDIRRFWGRVFESSGGNQPTIDELNADSPYAPDAYITLRGCYLRGAIREPSGYIDYGKVIEFAQERDEIYEEIGREGDEEFAQRRLGSLIDRRRFYSWGSVIDEATQAIKKLTGQDSMSHGRGYAS